VRIPVVTGPTAAGKTAVVLGFAEKYDIEIVSADAYQVYKYMNIGTAKPDSKELSKVPHHLIDVYTPDKTYSAGIFFEEGQRYIRDILDRGKMPVVTGGTGLYVQTLQKGIFKGPERDVQLRRKLESELEKSGCEAMHKELAETDPKFAASIKPTDPARVLRGLEINRQLNMNVREAQREFHQNPEFKYDIYILNEEREKIYSRINRRVDIMFELGWEGEVRELLKMGYSESLDSFKAIGYREIAGCVKGGYSTDCVKERIKTATRNFAKRQLTWFRRMEEVKYINIADKNELGMLEEFIFT